MSRPRWRVGSAGLSKSVAEEIGKLSEEVQASFRELASSSSALVVSQKELIAGIESRVVKENESSRARREHHAGRGTYAREPVGIRSEPRNVPQELKYRSKRSPAILPKRTTNRTSSNSFTSPSRRSMTARAKCLENAVKTQEILLVLEQTQRTGAAKPAEPKAGPDAQEQRHGRRTLPVFTDLTVGLLSLFILAFVAMATIKAQKAKDLTRTEEFVSCQEEMHSLSRRNATRFFPRASGVPSKGNHRARDGNIQIQASFLFPSNGAELTPRRRVNNKSIGKGLLVARYGRCHRWSPDSRMTIPRIRKLIPTGTFPRNAVNVVKTLVKQGFPPEKLFAAGFGEFHPAFRTRIRRTAASTAAWKSASRPSANGAAPQMVNPRWNIPAIPAKD